MQSSSPELLPLLKRYFGFSSFRPLQEEIIRDALAGKDVFALLPRLSTYLGHGHPANTYWYLSAA